MAIRIAMAVCLTIGCTLLGRCASHAARRRLKCLDDLINGAKILRIHIAGMCESVSQALAVTQTEPMVQVGREMDRGCSAADAWQRIRNRQYKRGGELDALVQHDRETLDALFGQLGGSGRREQAEMLSDTIERLSEQRDMAKMLLAERDKLYVTVGFLFGLILAVAVI